MIFCCVTAVSVCLFLLFLFYVLFAVFLALFLQATKLVHLNHMHSDGGGWGVGDEEEKKEERERENHSPSTVGKANDLSQPLLSPRLAERKLPAASTRNTHRKKIWLHMSAIAAAEQLFKRKKERKNIIKKKRREETGFEPWAVELQPSVLPTTLWRS